jgi:L-lactate dehydrogenase complex protein LldG
LSGAREAILARLRAGLGRTVEARAVAAAEIRARLAAPRPGPLPARARVGGEERIALFTRMAESVGAEVRRLADPSAIPATVLDHLRRHNLPARIVRAADPLLDAARLEAEPLLEVRTGVPEDSDPVGLTVALAGIAETGTLLLASAGERPTLLAFLPETSIVALPTVAVVGTYEEAWARLRGRAGFPPRSVNLITGPSRTGDIPPSIELGAHGPRRLLVLLVDGAPPAER